jgi:hypothetical protein
VSTDGAASWKQFKSEPAGAGNGTGAGNVAISADGAVLLWAPRGARTAYSKDEGATWIGCAGLPDPKPSPDWAPWYLRLAADRVNPNKFYAFDAQAGVVYASDDGGAHFSVASSDLRSMPEYELQYAGFRAVQDHEGDLWITTKTELAHSTDAGKTFSKVSGVEEAHAVGFGRAAPGETYPAVYLSGTVGGITGFFRSDDGGSNFIRINDDAHQYGGAQLIIGDPRVYGRVYVAPGGRGIIYGEPKAK